MRLEDAETIENAEAGTPAYYEALQRAINGGQAWKFQGSYGRAMMAAIEDGRCLLGPLPAEDAWGNRIPGRDEVEPGTKGGREFVVARHGEEWAARMEEVV